MVLILGFPFAKRAYAKGVNSSSFESISYRKRFVEEFPSEDNNPPRNFEARYEIPMCSTVGIMLPSKGVVALFNKVDSYVAEIPDQFIFYIMS